MARSTGAAIAAKYLLPADVWSLVLAYFSLAAVFRDFAPVCRLFRSIAWRRHAYLPCSDARLLAYADRTGIASHIRRLCLLRTKPWRRDAAPPYPTSLDDAFRLLPSLTALDIRDPASLPLLQSLAAHTRLRELSVYAPCSNKPCRGEHATLPPLERWLPMLASLQSLHIDSKHDSFYNRPGAVPLFAPHVLPALTGLRRLRVRVFDFASLFPDSATSEALAGAWPALEEFHLSVYLTGNHISSSIHDASAARQNAAAVRQNAAAARQNAALTRWIDEAADRLRALTLNWGPRDGDEQRDIGAALRRCTALTDLVIGERDARIVPEFVMRPDEYCPPALASLLLSIRGCDWLVKRLLPDSPLASSRWGGVHYRPLIPLLGARPWPASLRALRLQTTSSSVRRTWLVPLGVGPHTLPVGTTRAQSVLKARLPLQWEAVAVHFLGLRVTQWKRVPKRKRAAAAPVEATPPKRPVSSTERSASASLPVPVPTPAPLPPPVLLPTEWPLPIVDESAWEEWEAMLKPLLGS